MEALVKRYLAVHLSTLQIPVDSGALDGLEFILDNIVHELVSSLKQFQTIQRRTQPSKSDLQLLLQSWGIPLNELYEESQRKHPAWTPVLDTVPTQDATEMELGDLLPVHEKPKYVPSWLPELPPEHSYVFSAEYNARITDERHLREELVRESKLSSEALKHLLSDETCVAVSVPADSEPKLQAEPEPKVYAELEMMKAKPLDVEQYARQRVAHLRRRVASAEPKEVDVFSPHSARVLPEDYESKVREETKVIIGRVLVGIAGLKRRQVAKPVDEGEDIEMMDDGFGWVSEGEGEQPSEPYASVTQSEPGDRQGEIKSEPGSTQGETNGQAGSAQAQPGITLAETNGQPGSTLGESNGQAEAENFSFGSPNYADQAGSSPVQADSPNGLDFFDDLNMNEITF